MTFYPVTAIPTLGKPVLYAPGHLRRWRAALALADQQTVPVVVIGDSIMWGTGADNTAATSNANAVLRGVCTRLRSNFALNWRTLDQAVGEGYIQSTDSRVTNAGGINNIYACTPLCQGTRLIGAAETLTFTVPAGVTQVGVIQANMGSVFNAGGSGLADVTGQYNINAGGNTTLGALTSTNNPVVTTVAVTAGQVFQVIGPATAQTYICGFVLSTAAAAGIQVHRVAQNGLTSTYLVGASNNGVLNQAASLVNQGYASRACYAWNTTPGLVICNFQVNDQQFQNGGGAAGQNNITIGLYQTVIAQFCAQAVSDGWCVLLLATMRDQGFAPGFPTLDQYIATMKATALSTDHVAFLDGGEMWGTYANSQADGLQVVGSAHPNIAGHGDMAALLLDTLTGKAQAGITELIPG